VKACCQKGTGCGAKVEREYCKKSGKRLAESDHEKRKRAKKERKGLVKKKNEGTSEVKGRKIVAKIKVSNIATFSDAPEGEVEGAGLNLKAREGRVRKKKRGGIGWTFSKKCCEDRLPKIVGRYSQARSNRK